jgi:hypothetical protein
MMMANPLTLYVPIKQDPDTQLKAQLAYENFVSSVQAGLDTSNIVHYARLALIPNPGGEGILAICLITTFDGPMNPYLKYFWNDGALKTVFAGLAGIALNPPNPPVSDLTGFENFINDNNLNTPDDLYNAYGQTVLQIRAQFPPQA